MCSERWNQGGFLRFLLKQRTKKWKNKKFQEAKYFIGLEHTGDGGKPSRSEGGVCGCVLTPLSRVRLSVTPWTAARQAPVSTGFSRQEHWSGLPCSPPGDLSGPALSLCPSPGLAGGSFTTSATWDALQSCSGWGWVLRSQWQTRAWNSAEFSTRECANQVWAPAVHMGPAAVSVALSCPTLMTPGTVSCQARILQ